MAKLGVNIDHVATLRQARRELDPDPIQAAKICLKAGCHSIVAHLREDRRHIQDQDIINLQRIAKGRLNLEMSMNKDIVLFAAKLKPWQVTLVPEKRQEITTEGGLDVEKYFQRVRNTTKKLSDKGIEVSLFVDPIKKQIDKSFEAGVRIIELHTGTYDRARTKASQKKQLDKLTRVTAYAHDLGMTVNAGHGLKYDNTKPIAKIPHMNELNIGHSIISQAIFVGLEKAVKDMLRITR